MLRRLVGARRGSSNENSLATRTPPAPQLGHGQRLAELQRQQAHATHGYERRAIAQGSLLEQRLAGVQQDDRTGIRGAPTLASVLDDPTPANDSANYRRRLSAAGEEEGATA